MNIHKKIIGFSILVIVCESLVIGCKGIRSQDQKITSSNPTQQEIMNAVKDQTPSKPGMKINESHYPVLMTVQWKKHGIYLVQNQYKPEDINPNLGKQVGIFNCDGYDYELYEIKGENTSKAIAVKNNNVYYRYTFAYSDIVNFNGHTYIIGAPTENRKGTHIGMSGANDVYKLEGLDPEKVIDVYMNTSSATGESTIMQGGDFTAYREDE